MLPMSLGRRSTLPFFAARSLAPLTSDPMRDRLPQTRSDALLLARAGH
ncbi:hypothetical protein LCGC14_3067160, partial [marine sediment metagenome]